MITTSPNQAAAVNAPIDVLGLAPDENAEIVRLNRGDQFHAGRGTILIDCFPADVAQRDGIRGEVKCAMFPHELRTGGGTSMVQSFDAVKNVQHGFVPNQRHRDHRRDKCAARI